MKRFAKFLLINSLVVTAFVIALSSCTQEGPAGKDGLNGTNGINGKDGKDANSFCKACHNATTMSTIETQFESSKHAEGESWPGEGVRRDCAACHSLQGFLETQQTGLDTTAYNPKKVGSTYYNAFGVGQPLDCSGCHDFHKSFDTTDGKDYAFRRTAGVSLRWGNHTVTVDLKGSNGCIICHQARTTTPMPTSMTGTDSITITSLRYGPHYGAMGNMFAGKAPYEFTGTETYTNSAHTTQTSCATCHMATFKGTGVNSAGGHTFRIKDTLNVVNLAGCQSCHAGTTTADINGKQTEIKGLMTQLATKLDALKPGGILEKGTDGKPDGYVIASTSKPLKLTSKQTAALLNWTFVYRDLSSGVHNYKYTKALLTNTIAALP